MLTSEGSNCEFCGFWVQNTDTWSCEECNQYTCESCGKFDGEEKIYLCPECFSQEKPK